MKLDKMDLGNLSEMDGGKLDATVRRAFDRAAADLVGRPTTGGAREVTIKFRLTPVADEEGELDDILLGWEVTDKLPRQKSKSYGVAAREDGDVQRLYLLARPVDDEIQHEIREVDPTLRIQKGRATS